MQLYEIIVLKMCLKLTTRPQIGLGGEEFFFCGVGGGGKVQGSVGGSMVFVFFKNSMFNFF